MIHVVAFAVALMIHVVAFAVALVILMILLTTLCLWRLGAELRHAHARGAREAFSRHGLAARAASILSTVFIAVVIAVVIVVLIFIAVVVGVALMILMILLTTLCLWRLGAELRHAHARGAREAFSRHCLAARAAS